MRRLAFLAAASLGLGVALIVDQPAAFARCDRGSCPCRDKSIWGDSVDDSKCPGDKFCAQVVAAKWGTDHVYVCEPRKLKGWGCTRDRQCKCGTCQNGKCSGVSRRKGNYYCKLDKKPCGRCLDACETECKKRTGCRNYCNIVPTKSFPQGKEICYRHC